MRTHFSMRPAQKTVQVKIAIYSAVFTLIGGAAFFLYGNLGSTKKTLASSFNSNDYCGSLMITIDKDLVSGTGKLDDFPVYLDITRNELKSNNNGGDLAGETGYDIRITDDNNVKQEIEIISYSASSGNLKCWVKVDELSGSDDTKLYLYYGNSQKTSSNPSSSSVWTSDYKAVYHLEDYSDATSNSNDGTNQGCSTATAVLGNGIYLDGNSDYVDVGHTSSLNISGNSITMSAWVKLSGPMAVDAAFMVKAASTNQEYYMLGVDGGSNPAYINTRVTTNAGHYRHDESTYASNQWAYVTFVYDGSLGSNQKVTYLNGVKVADQSASGNISTGSGPFRIGRRVDNRYFKGYLDELRVSTNAKSADWVKTEYNNQIDPSSFYSISSNSSCNAGSSLLSDTADFCGKLELTIDKDGVDGSSTLYNFPVYLDITHSNLKSIGYDGFVGSSLGYDIAVTNSSGDVLPIELADYEPSTGNLKFWVEVDELYGNVDTDLYLFHGNIADTSTNPSSTDVWSSDYRAVYHFEDYNDATENENHGSNYGCSTVVAQIGNGIDLDGSSDYVNVPSSSSLNISGDEITLSAWVKINTPHGSDAAIAVKGAYTNQEYYMFGIDGGTSPGKVNTRVTTSRGHYRHDEGTISDNSWCHVAFVYDGGLGSNQKKTYVNGVMVADQYASGNINTGSAALMIGKRTDNRMLDGRIDELRIAGTARSASWIKTAYTNQSQPDYFCTVSVKKSCGKGALPVQLIQFDGQRNEDYNVITWTTASEIDNDFFDLQRKSPGVDEWISIAEIPGNGTSNHLNRYSYEDHSIFSDETQIYRLRQVDYDGEFEFSGQVFIGDGSNTSSVDVKVGPNPCFDKTYLHYSTDVDVEAELIGINGVKVKSLLLQKGVSVHEIPMAGLRKGVYSLVSDQFSIKIQKL